MQFGYLTEYRTWMDTVKNKVFRLKLQFDSIKSKIDKDFRNGVLTKEEYEVLKSADILTYISLEYSLSKEDIEFLRKYADIENGELMFNFIKDEYEDKAKKIEKVCLDASIGAYFLSLPFEERRMSFLNACTIYYDKELAKVSVELDQIKAQCGDNYYMYPSFTEKDKRFRELRKGRMAIDRVVPLLTEEELNKRIIEFYDLNPSTIEWYLEKDALFTLEDESFYYGHKVDAGCLDISISSLFSLLDRKHDISVKILQYRYNLQLFLENGIKAYSYDSDIPKKKRFFGRKKINIEEYQNLFKNLLDFKVFVEYLRSFYEGDILNVSEAFDAYVTNTYPSGLPDLKTFRLDLFLNVSSYIDDKLAEFELLERKVDEDIDYNKKELTHRSSAVSKGAKGIEHMVHISHQVERKKLDDIFTSEEEDKIYRSVRSVVEDAKSKTEGAKKLTLEGK